MIDFEAQRKRMVEEQIAARGVRDPRVLEAMRKVPREAFVSAELRDVAYADRPLPIGADQTISQPYIVAFMIEALLLQNTDKALEIGAGSGYAAAVLAEIAGEVFAVERIDELARMARVNLANAGYRNIKVLHDDGTRGWRDEAPFDAILVSAGAPNVPNSLQEQLAVDGRMVIPVGRDAWAQELVRVIHRPTGQFEREDLAAVRFVPLIGEEGWIADDPNTGAGRSSHF